MWETNLWWKKKLLCIWIVCMDVEMKMSVVWKHYNTKKIQIGQNIMIILIYMKAK